MLSWRFFLTNNDLATPVQVEVDEPIGWDGVEFTLNRSVVNEGLETVISSELEFFDGEFEGFTYLFEAFELQSYDSNVDIEIRSYCNDAYQESYFGYLNFMFYEHQGNSIKIQFEESSFARRFKNRIDTPINLDNPIGIDGQDLTEIDRATIKLHSKEIVLTIEADNNTDVFDKSTFGYIYQAAESPPNQLYYTKLFTIAAGGDTCDTKSASFYIQFSPANPIVSDESLFEYYNIPNGISENINAIGRVLQSGTVTISVPFDMAAWVWGQGNNDVGQPKLCDCDDSQENSGNKHFLDHFDFQLLVRVGGQTQTQGLSSGDRDSCTDRFYGDLVGKNDQYDSGVFVEDMEDTLTRPFSPAEASAFNRKVRFVENTFEFTFDNVTTGDDVYVLVECNINAEFENRVSDSGVIYNCEAYLSQGMGFEITSTTTTTATETTGYLIYEALNRTAESITGRNDAIRSDYFGRTDSVPKQYDEIGCEALNLYTNGKSIRNLTKEDGTPYAINVTFQDMINDLSQKRCIGYRVERIGGVDYVRIEPIEYFYSNDSIITFSNVEGIKREVAKTRLWNDFEIGYNKWEIENINGIDEFNTKHNYSIAATNIKQKLQATTNYIAGGYAIEMTRRLQASENPTVDWKYDDDIFIISLNRIEVTTDVYTGVEETFQPGEVSERNELFDSVENVISPETSYNLRFSPARCAMYWFKKLAPALIKKANQALKFQSGTGNILMITEMSELDTCRNTSGTLQENQDITASASIFLTLDRIALFQPIWISFEYPLTYSEFILIRDNSNKAITAVCGDETFVGYLEEIRHRPNINGGIAEFKLLLGFCYNGEYDDSFSDAFNVGTC